MGKIGSVKKSPNLLACDHNVFTLSVLMKAHPPFGRRRGFALIATISMLLLLTVIAVAFLSLSTLTVRSARTDYAAEEARANAKMALLIAIGELQRDLGPDRRVTANASIFDKSPQSEEVTGVDHEHWLGAWRTDYFDRDNDSGWSGTEGNFGTPFVRNAMRGGLTDLRTSRSWDRENAAINWFVSGNEGGVGGKERERRLLKPTRSEIDSDEASESTVLLVGPGSVKERKDRVAVQRTILKKVQNTPTGQRAPVESGSYAYWVSDLGQKANIGLGDRRRENNISDNGTGMERVTHTQAINPSALSGVRGVDDADLEKVITTNSFALLSGVGKAAQKELFHDVTSYSRSVLSNTRDGGLQKNLTAFLRGRDIERYVRNNDRRYAGLDGNDNMVGPQNGDYDRGAEAGSRYSATLHDKISPKFSLLKDFAARLGDTNFRNPEVVQDSGYVNDFVQSEADVNVYDRFNTNGPSIAPLQALNLNPVVTEATFYYNLGVIRRQGRNGFYWQVRFCFYPQICLWNPYNVEMSVPQTTAQVFLNGNKRVRLTDGDGGTAYLKTLRFGSSDSTGVPGMCFFSLPEVLLAPGECVMFCPEATQEYEVRKVSQNRLSPRVRPNAGIYFYQDITDAPDLGKPGQDAQYDTRNEDMTERTSEFEEDPLEGKGRTLKANGADNLCIMLKRGWVSGTFVPNNKRQREAFARLPMIAYVNNALQAGGSNELAVDWNAQGQSDRAEVYNFRNGSGQSPLSSRAHPDARTRDTIRLRWWRETRSNFDSNGLSPQALQSSLLGNWNVRAAYSCRTPWDTVSPQPPFQFGMYIGDVPDQNELTFENEMQPRQIGGKNIANPFGQHKNAPRRLVVYELPSDQTGIPSLAYFRHMKASEFAWHAGSPIANSIADPRVFLQHSNASIEDTASSDKLGWNEKNLGVAVPTRDSGNFDPDGGFTKRTDYWAFLTRGIIYRAPDKDGQHTVYDLSFELNHSLWDKFFLSSALINRSGRNQLRNFVDDPEANPLPNGRFSLFYQDERAKQGIATGKPITRFFQTAYFMALDGGFNVNSTSVEAWAAFLSATKDRGFPGTKGTPFPRLLNPQASSADARAQSSDSEVLAGFRALSDSEVKTLARKIVAEVKTRAPFLGLGDFVNRRLTTEFDRDKRQGNRFIGKRGAIESAIYEADINGSLMDESEYFIDTEVVISGDMAENMENSQRLDNRLKPESVLWGLPGYLTQGDVMQVIGSSIRTRSDSFKIRAYGDSRGPNGKIRARAWCEAIVQRMPEPVKPDESVDESDSEDGLSINPELERLGNATNFGRRFQMVSFRWLNKDEI